MNKCGVGHGGWKNKSEDTFQLCAHSECNHFGVRHSVEETEFCSIRIQSDRNVYYMRTTRIDAAGRPGMHEKSLNVADIAHKRID